MSLDLLSITLGTTLIADLLLSALLILGARYLKIYALSNIAIVSLLIIGFMSVDLSVYSVLVSLISWFRLVNLSRITYGRMNRHELQQRYSKTAIWLAIYSVLVISAMYLLHSYNLLVTYELLSAAGALGIIYIGIFTLNKWRNSGSKSTVKLSSIQTVSVCIPARNETQDLPGCIESVLASGYPKLEILVLDDCSHDKTPAIIKKYAHDGVRFITGEEPDDKWLAKNAAMSKLFQESKGEIVIFAGVDVRFSKDTVQKVVNQLQNGIQMLSVLPVRDKSKELTVFIQPLRYWWELILAPIFKRQASLSTCWAINSESFKSLGGFGGYSRSVQPESHLAKRLKEKYKFILNGDHLGVSSIKRPTEQYETALRKKYPQAKHRPEVVLLLIVLEFLVLLFPVYSMVINLVTFSFYGLLLSIFSIFTLGLLNVYISYLTVSKSWIIGFISLYYLLPLEWYLLIRSMLGYEFGRILWKDRNICLPLLTVEDSLPEL